jgi:class 3 adenylate cyclase/tetratricopeptide (TPR) repeat protein
VLLYLDKDDLTAQSSAARIIEPEATAVDVGAWLKSLGLEQYEAAFRENDVDAEILPTLTADELKDIGVSSIRHRRRLLEAIAKLQNASAPLQTARPSGDHSASTPAEDTASSSGERRQLTVMFCDLVGSTALSEKLDPEELRTVLHGYRTACGDAITRYDGFVARYVGDGILTYFGWPAAHEEDAERAVRAALDIVDAVKHVATSEPLSMRIGIATGPVVVGEAAGVGDQARLAIGSTPNLAARLQGVAAADQVVIAASTRRLIGNAFDLSDLGEYDLKGIAEPVHAWRVERALTTDSRFEARHGQEGLTPLVGREEEVDLLLRRWSQAQDGEGQVVLLGGEPGIGKSRILSVLRERLEAQGVQALRFQCSPYYVNSAFWPIINNLERALRFGRDETAEAKLDRLEALIVTQYGRPLADVRFVASILPIPCEDRYGPLTMTPQRHKDETLRTLVDVTEAAARRQPSVLLFEDAYWADPTTLEVLDLLIDRVKAMPLLVVLTHRPEFQSRWSGHSHVGALNLSKLTRAQSAAMIAALAGGKALPEPLLEQILTRTDGVPLFVEELTKSILESGELKETGDHYEYAGSARSVTIPATLRDSLMARLDRFMPVREVAQIGAAIGREFSYELIEAVAPMPQAQLDDALARLCESGLAFRRGTPPDAIYTFKHALVQDAAYDSLLKRRRQELHAKIARVIEQRSPSIKTTEPEVLAHHLTAAGRAEAAVPLWQRAGELALQRMALTEAIAHLNQGLKLIATLPPSPKRDAYELELRTRLGTAWMALNGWAMPEVWNSLHPALGLAKSLGRQDALTPILSGLFNNVLTQGRVAEALQLAQQTLDLAHATGDPGLLITGHELVCTGYCYAGELTKALEHASTVLDLYDDERHRHLANILNHDPKTRVGTHASICLWMLGYPDQALRLNDDKDAHARRRGHPFDIGWALAMGAHVFDHRYGHEELRKRAEEVERLGRENSLPVLWAVMAPFAHGQALVRQGKPAEAIAPVKAGIAALEAIGGKLLCPSHKSFLAKGMAQTGDLDNALDLIDEQIIQIERPGWEERLYYAEILRLKGGILSLKGDLEGAERNFLASLDWARRQQAKSWELRTAMSLARLWQSQGKRQKAYELLAPVYDWFTEGFDTKDLQEAKVLLAELR